MDGKTTSISLAEYINQFVCLSTEYNEVAPDGSWDDRKTTKEFIRGMLNTLLISVQSGMDKDISGNSLIILMN